MKQEQALASNRDGDRLSGWLSSQEDRFGYLLILLVAAFMVTGMGDARVTVILGAVLNVAALGAAVLASGVRWERTGTALMAAAGVIGVVLLIAFSGFSVGAGVGALCQAAVLGAVLVAVIRRVLAHERVELSTLLGAIAGYFLIGLIFAWVFAALSRFLDRNVLEPAQDGLPVYYSFVVLTTLGFGDVVAVDELARRLTAIEAMVGQIFLATLVARLVSLYGKAQSAAGDPD